MGDVIELHGQLAHLEDDELVENLARFADGTLSEAAVKHGTTSATRTGRRWARATGSSNLSRPAKLRRIRSGATKRECAQIEIVDGPPILGKIMRDPNANERHRIDLIKTLDALASTGPKLRQRGLDSK